MVKNLSFIAPVNPQRLEVYFVKALDRTFYQKGCITNRFQVAVCLFSNTSQMTSKCGKNKKVAHEAQPSVSLMYSPHFDVLCDLLLNRPTATWNLFVLYNKELKKSFNDDVIYTSVL